MSPIGLVCPRCKQRLYTQPPLGHCMSYWESQPAAYSTEGEPCFVFTLAWDDFRIRSLHPPHSDTDKRAEKVKQIQSVTPQRRQRTPDERKWLDILKYERWLLNGFQFENQQVEGTNPEENRDEVEDESESWKSGEFNFDELNFDEIDDWSPDEG
ncbi:MAG: hypothetical protein IH899_02865 [Planctomycetes bacterium]|nr:hypothetical protein [Planctomycetota bacterium]